MPNTKSNDPSCDRNQAVVAELQRLLAVVCQKGFHGTATLTVSLQDGHVQHVRVASERMIRV
ncbi:MAG: hypothetical protein RH917_19335 [Lacipirellulaceae bacterium]